MLLRMFAVTLFVISSAACSHAEKHVDRPSNLRRDSRLMMMQLEVAVLQNDDAKTQRAVFCRNNVRPDLFGWELDDKILAATLSMHKDPYQAIIMARNVVFDYGMALNCWNKKDGQQKALEDGRAFFAKVGKLEGVFNASKFQRLSIEEQDWLMPKKLKGNFYASFYRIEGISEYE